MIYSENDKEMRKMRFNWSDIPIYKIEGEVYSLVSSFNTKDRHSADKAFARLYQMMKYYADSYNVSFLLGLSNTAGNRAKRKLKRVRGNPKVKILGKKVLYHAHAVIIGDNAERFATEIVKRRNKADGKTLTKKKAVKDLASPEDVSVYDSKGMEIVGYVHEQSIRTLSYPKDGFDFTRFYGSFFRIKQD